MYDVPVPAAGPAWLALQALKGKTYSLNAVQGQSATFVDFTYVQRPFSPVVQFHVTCDCVGIAPAVLIGIIAASAALTAVAICTWATASEIRRVLITPAGQKTLGAVAPGLGTMAVLLPVLVVGVLAVAAWFYFRNRGSK